MISYPDSISRLIDELRKLPGVGPKSAQRMAFYLLGQPSQTSTTLAEAILQARNSVTHCSICCNWTERDPCLLCSDPRRDKSIICVVEEPKDVAAIEKTREFKGLYHVLHGSISPLDGIGPEDIRIRELLQRLHSDDVKEIILASDPNIEGDATALYISRLVRPTGIRTTRIAHGLPVGGDLEYADEVTLARALEGRRDI
jgi:recombination protein RecR